MPERSDFFPKTIYSYRYTKPKQRYTPDGVEMLHKPQEEGRCYIKYSYLHSIRTL